MAKSEDISERSQRYLRIERVADSIGRTIGVKRLKPSQMRHIEAMTPGFDGATMIVDEKTGAEIQIPKRADFIFCASVVEIDGVAVVFPKNRAELDAIYDRMDREGIIAIAEAYGKLLPQDEPDESQKDPIEEAKN